jgi:pimeloyl-ACP methyl ester carboxylesterase
MVAPEYAKPRHQFDQLILQRLARSHRINYWQYEQELDEGCCLQNAIDFLDRYLQPQTEPIHLVGHGLSGTLALLYARRHPEKVRSLTLLAVAAQPAVTWHSHYYTQRHLLPISQVQLLAQMAVSLFGHKLPHEIKPLTQLLAKDLAIAPAPHSLYNVAVLPEMGVAMPLLVCGSQTDFVVTPPLLKRWVNFFKPGDTLWQCPDGHHFFHHSRSELVVPQILKFWAQTQKREIKIQSLAMMP